MLQHACGAPRAEQPKCAVGQEPRVVVVVAWRLKRRRGLRGLRRRGCCKARGVEKGQIERVEARDGMGVEGVVVEADVEVMLIKRRRR